MVIEGDCLTGSVSSFQSLGAHTEEALSPLFGADFHWVLKNLALEVL